jgi:hypothetical protein
MSELELVLNEQLRYEYSAEGMEELFLRLDRLHDLVVAGQLGNFSALSRAELQGWLEDLIYTARETIQELQAASPIEN